LDHFDASCLAVAGPVKDNICKMTNLDWVIDGRAISKGYNIADVAVINDFVAIGYGIASIEPSERISINNIVPEARGPIAIIGPGTGLGEAFMLWDHRANAYVVIPTEGSHAPLAPKNAKQLQLIQHMWDKSNTCEIEQVCSGPGLRNIYEFVCTSRKVEVRDIQPSEITERALANSCELCLETVMLFLEILGSECSNMGLRVLATGGVYVAGGIPPKILPLLLGSSALIESFNSHNSNIKSLVDTFPLIVVQHPNLGLSGAKAKAMRQLGI